MFFLNNNIKIVINIITIIILLLLLLHVLKTIFVSIDNRTRYNISLLTWLVINIRNVLSAFIKLTHGRISLEKREF